MEEKIHVGKGMCKKCYDKSYKESNPELIKLRQVNYYKNNRVTLREKSQRFRDENREITSKDRNNNRLEKKDVYNKQSREWKTNNKDSIRNSKLKDNYGITLIQYNQLLESQNQVCAICNKPEYRIDYRTKEVKYLSVDHCHKTGEIRGLLCSKCNIGIAHFDDDENLFIKAIEYLRNNK